LGNRKVTKRRIDSMDKSEKMLYWLKAKVNLYQLQKIFVDWDKDDKPLKRYVKD